MTPRNYLSWTQMDLVERSPKRYVEVYLDGGNIPVNRGMAYGKKVATALEENELTGDPVLDLVLLQMPQLKKKEHEISTELNGVPLFGKIDDFDMRTKKKLNEYKTGLTTSPWTQKRVDEHKQIDFYCSMVYAKYGIKPEDMDLGLVWIPTQYDKNGRVEATGEWKVFKTKRTLADILKISARQKKAWEKIQELTMQSLV